MKKEARMSIADRNVHSPRAILFACVVFTCLIGAGCTQTGKNAIPSGADRVASGRGSIDYRAMRDGEIWVYDVDTQKMVYNGQVRDGDRVRVDTTANQIVVGGRTVSDR